MVLEGAAASPDSFSNDSSPSSDADAYSSSSTGGLQSLPLDGKSLWKPIPILGPLMGYTRERLNQNLDVHIKGMSSVIKRPFTDQEIEAYIYHESKDQAITSYGLPIGVAAGYWRYRNTKSTYRFPFYAPDPEKFKLRKFGPITGARAQLAWHSLRFISYVGFGGKLASLVIGVYGTTVAVTGLKLDPRLKDFNADIRAIPNDEAKRRLQAVLGQGLGTQTASANKSSSWDEARSTASTMATIDLASRPELQERNSDDTNTLNSSSRGSSRPTRHDQQRKQPAPQESTVFDFDDASPTAGSPESSGGSAWDRLRRGENPAPQSQSRPIRGAASQADAWASRRGGNQGLQAEQRDGSTVGDRAEFSRNDDEKERARAQAQRDFDERLERERRGGDLNDDQKWR